MPQKFRNVFRKLSVATSALTLAAVAQAANILVLSTTESPTDADYNTPLITSRVANEFGAGGANTVDIHDDLNIAGTVSAATFIPPAGGRYDVVVVLSTYENVANDNMAAITTAIQNNSASAFVLFMDGCCEPSRNTNVTKLKDALNMAIGGSAITVGSTGGTFNAPLNGASPYSSSFMTLDPLRVGAVNYLAGVPSPNILYLPDPSQPGVSGQAMGVLFPRSQVNAGRGACVFGIVDISLWANPSGLSIYTQNEGKIGPAFLTAATAPGGACGVAGAVSKAFAPTSLSPGDQSQLTITLSNNTLSPATGVELTDALPAPLQIAGAATTTCGGNLSAAQGTTSVNLSGAGIPPGTGTPSNLTPGSCTITVPVTWPNTPPAQLACAETSAPVNPVTNTITPGVDFTTNEGQVSTVATASLSCVPRTVPPEPPEPVATIAAVPTQSNTALMLMGFLAALMGWRQQRQRARQA